MISGSKPRRNNHIVAGANKPARWIKRCTVEYDHLLLRSLTGKEQRH